MACPHRVRATNPEFTLERVKAGWMPYRGRPCWAGSEALAIAAGPWNPAAVLGKIFFDFVLVALVIIGSLGLMVQGVWTLLNRRVPQPVVRLRGEAIARYPVRLGGFWLLLGAALLVSTTVDLLDISHGAGTAMFVVAGVAILSSVVWYALRRD
jgi:hypothetical protein